jgi:hypothetical protein
VSAQLAESIVPPPKCMRIPFLSRQARTSPREPYGLDPRGMLPCAPGVDTRAGAVGKCHTGSWAAWCWTRPAGHGKVGLAGVTCGACVRHRQLVLCMEPGSVGAADIPVVTGSREIMSGSFRGRQHIGAGTSIPIWGSVRMALVCRPSVQAAVQSTAPRRRRLVTQWEEQ